MRGTGNDLPLIKLPAVPQGAHISIVAPASFARPERVELGLAALGRLGYVPRVAENGLARGPLFFAGTAEQRVGDLHGAFASRDSQMVMCLRGGYGSNYVLPRLELEVSYAARRPWVRITVAPSRNGASGRENRARPGAIQAPAVSIARRA